MEHVTSHSTRRISASSSVRTRNKGSEKYPITVYMPLIHTDGSALTDEISAELRYVSAIKINVISQMNGHKEVWKPTRVP